MFRLMANKDQNHNNDKHNDRKNDRKTAMQDWVAVKKLKLSYHYMDVYRTYIIVSEVPQQQHRQPYIYVYIPFKGAL